ncbi:hypothetical protein EXQ39_03935 [Clostridium botulinum]|nr:hypothetical protein [Clostridium botulinum]
MFQNYLCNFIKKNLNLNSSLQISLNNKVKAKEYEKPILDIGDKEYGKLPTIADILQLLIIGYNIGHFKNTFTSSRAAIKILKCNNECYQSFIDLFEFQVHKSIAERIIANEEYHRFHLLNSLLILLSLDNNIKSIKLTVNILTNYLLEDTIIIRDKFKFIFDLFRKIRSVAFVTYDLLVAPVPIYIDINNTRYLENLLRELLSNYNNKTQINNLFRGLQKLLQDTVYNEKENALIQYSISNKMANLGLKNKGIVELIKSNYIDFIDSQDELKNIFNRTYPRIHDFDTRNILKLTFANEELIDIQKLSAQLESMNFVRVAWYNRKGENKNTLIVGIAKKCIKKEIIALKVLRLIVNSVYSKKEFIDKYQDKLLLVTKFFLFYLFKEHNVELIGTLDKQCCISVERGKRKRISAIEKLLRENENYNEDFKHEINVLANHLKNDCKNDVGITICSSILIKENSRKKSEFDGLIIFPNRSIEQILFVESKNTTEKPSYSKKCIKEKFQLLGIDYEEDKIIIDGMDCYYKYTI